MGGFAQLQRLLCCQTAAVAESEVARLHVLGNVPIMDNNAPWKAGVRRTAYCGRAETARLALKIRYFLSITRNSSQQLVATESGHRIESRGAPSRHIARQAGANQQQKYDGDHRERV